MIVDPDDDDGPLFEDDLAEYLICRNWGCLWSVEFYTGGFDQARAARDRHEQSCQHRIFPPNHL